MSRRFKTYYAIITMEDGEKRLHGSTDFNSFLKFERKMKENIRLKNGVKSYRRASIFQSRRFIRQLKHRLPDNWNS